MDGLKRLGFKGVVEVGGPYFGGVNRKKGKKYRSPFGRGRGDDNTVVFGVKERE